MIPDECEQRTPSDEQGADKGPPLALPAPEQETTTKLNVTSQQTMTLDHLGPMVVNFDGTLSRIHNWAEMTDMEKERTLRVLAKRNRLRTEALRDQDKQ